MNKEEAIKILDAEEMSLRRLAIDSNIPQLKPKYEAIVMAIEALKTFGCTDCEHYDQQQTAMICKECRRYYKDKHSQYESYKTKSKGK